MPADRGAVTRTKFISVATDLIRRNGYTGTTVDDICARSGLTKGAFFHHFKTKDDLVRACLMQWDAGAAAMESRAPFQQAAHPRDRVLGYMDLYIALFDDPQMVKSCLAGTTVQEVADTNAPLRDAANFCFVNAIGRFSSLLDAACHGARPRVNTRELAALWMATVQGSLILSKAAQDADVIRRNLQQVKDYIANKLATPARKGSKRS
jgi:TetR/AcrR family transcriptional regulator, transcriptional repressor for nem operon